MPVKWLAPPAAQPISKRAAVDELHRDEQAIAVHAGVEDRDEGRVVDASVELGDELASLADEVGLDLKSVREIAAVAGFGNLS